MTEQSQIRAIEQATRETFEAYFAPAAFPVQRTLCRQHPRSTAITLLILLHEDHPPIDPSLTLRFQADLHNRLVSAGLSREPHIAILDRHDLAALADAPLQQPSTSASAASQAQPPTAPSTQSPTITDLPAAALPTNATLPDDLDWTADVTTTLHAGLNNPNPHRTFNRLPWQDVFRRPNNLRALVENGSTNEFHAELDQIQPITITVNAPTVDADGILTATGHVYPAYNAARQNRHTVYTRVLVTATLTITPRDPRTRQAVARYLA